MNAYGKERHAFGSPINNFGQVSPKLDPSAVDVSTINTRPQQMLRALHVHAVLVAPADKVEASVTGSSGSYV